MSRNRDASKGNENIEERSRASYVQIIEQTIFLYSSDVLVFRAARTMSDEIAGVAATLRASGISPGVASIASTARTVT